MLVDPDDRVDMINGEFDEFQEELVIRNRKLKLIVSYDMDDDIMSLLSDINGKSLMLEF